MDNHSSCTDEQWAVLRRFKKGLKDLRETVTVYKKHLVTLLIVGSSPLYINVQNHKYGCVFTKTVENRQNINSCHLIFLRVKRQN